MLYLSDESAAGRLSAGGYATAAAFRGDARRISQDWVAAWSGADDGYRAEQVVTAARLDAEAKKERDAANEERIRVLGERSKARRQGRPWSEQGSRRARRRQPRYRRRQNRASRSTEMNSTCAPKMENWSAEGSPTLLGRRSRRPSHQQSLRSPTPAIRINPLLAVAGHRTTGR
jgi:hypothetical protein